MTPSAPGRSEGEVRLRDVTERDLPVLFEHQMDPEANRMAAFPARDRGAFTAHWTRILADGTVITRTILFDGRVAGSVGSFERLGAREVGYWIGREYWGRGIATRALSQFLGLDATRPLYARVAAHNLASIRVLEKCGFVPDRPDRLPSLPGDDVEEVILMLEA